MSRNPICENLRNLWITAFVIQVGRPIASAWRGILSLARPSRPAGTAGPPGRRRDLKAHTNLCGRGWSAAKPRRVKSAMRGAHVLRARADECVCRLQETRSGASRWSSPGHPKAIAGAENDVERYGTRLRLAAKRGGC